MNSINGNNKPLHGKTTILSSFNDANIKKPIMKYRKQDMNIMNKILCYPPSYPEVPQHNTQPSWKKVPSAPIMTIKNVGDTVTLTWHMNNNLKASRIKMYELYVCQKTETIPHTSMWKKLDNINAMKLPMFCEIAKFDMGHTYYFILRAVDIHNRRAPFALQEITI